MKAWLTILLLAQAPAPAPVGSPPQAADAPRLYTGTLGAARLELAQLSKQEHHDEARALCERLAATLEGARASESERAETLYAMGVARGRAGAIDEAVDAFHRARGLAGSDELGRACQFNAGTYRLIAAEGLRELVPEIAQKLGLPQPPAPQAPARAGAEADPLELAHAAYLEARAELVERWRADPADVDTRANLELVQRRLRELDQLREQREQEQEQQDSDQQQNDQNQDSQQQQEQGDQQQKDPQQQDSEQQSEQPEQQPDPQDAQDQEQPEPEEGPDQPPKPDQAKPREEMLMTPEEIQRLLDKLADIDERAAEIQAMLRERRREPVKKDW